jgi:hypothetical protein
LVRPSDRGESHRTQLPSVRRVLRKRKLPYPFVAKRATSWLHWGYQCNGINRCKDAMRKWCKQRGIDFASLPPIVPPQPPVGMGPRPFGPVKDLKVPASFDVWDYALS